MLWFELVLYNKTRIPVTVIKIVATYVLKEVPKKDAINMIQCIRN